MSLIIPWQLHNILDSDTAKPPILLFRKVVNSEAFTGCPGATGKSSSAATTPPWSWSCILCCAWKQSIWRWPWGGKGAAMEWQGWEQTERLCVSVSSAVPKHRAQALQGPSFPLLLPFLPTCYNPGFTLPLLPDTGETREVSMRLLQILQCLAEFINPFTSLRSKLPLKIS